MSRLEDLPPDQHATLSLVLGRRKSYAEVAALLGIAEHAVHHRAHAALAVLAPQKARELSPERREEVGDYLLGQASVAGRLATRTYLDGSAEGRAWAHAISAEIAPLSTAALPEIPPGEPPPAADAREDGGGAPPPRAEPATSAGGPASGGPPSSRLGGALLLGAIAAAVIVAVILITGGGGGSHAKTNTTAASSGGAPGASTSSTASTGASGPTVNQRINLTPSDPTSKAIGAVEILSEGNRRAYYLAAEHLPPTRGFFYAIWLYNSQSSHLALNRSPAVGANGVLTGGALLPENAGNYHQILLTRETSTRPSHPGPIVLSGPFSLGH